MLSRSHEMLPRAHEIFRMSLRGLRKKQVQQIRHLCYSERLKRLNLPTLRYRRQHGDMIEVYKILHGIYVSEVTGDTLQLF